MTEINRDLGIYKSVPVTYFEPGHTFTSADAFHHQIEQGMREKKMVEDFQDFQGIVSKKGKSLLMEASDFLEVPKGVSSTKFAQSKPKLKDVLIVNFKKGTFGRNRRILRSQISCKRNIRISILMFLLQKFCDLENINFCRRIEPRGVCTEKRDNIVQKLCPHMKENRREFWEKLHVDANSRDLVKEQDPSEDVVEDKV